MQAASAVFQASAERPTKGAGKKRKRGVVPEAGDGAEVTSPLGKRGGAAPDNSAAENVGEVPEWLRSDKLVVDLQGVAVCQAVTIANASALPAHKVDTAKRQLAINQVCRPRQAFVRAGCSLERHLYN